MYFNEVGFAWISLDYSEELFGLKLDFGALSAVFREKWLCFRLKLGLFWLCFLGLYRVKIGLSFLPPEEFFRQIFIS